MDQRAGAGRCGVLITDDRGKLEHLDSCAREWFRRERPGDTPDAPCWEQVGLRTVDGEPFCGSQCALLRQAAAGPLEATYRVQLPEPTGGGSLELHSRVVPGPDGNRILHVLLPRTAGKPGTPEPHQAPEVPAGPSRIDRLTHREYEILERLAEGRSTGEIAGELGVTVVTVRNHVQHILHKLEVHGRLEAILAWMHSRDDR